MERGTVIAERFEIEELAGRGGMGEVYRARDRRGGGLAAIKVMLGASLESSERFVREAEILAELRHPGIVAYLAHGVIAADRPYFAMEWVAGETLAERLDRRGLTIGESIELILRVADALAVAHARGVVHRDLKPSNIVLCDGALDRVKVLDFGIARRAFGETTITATGAVVGTPAFMSPEQARGAAVDARADVFALGCVLYKCITGRVPFDAATIPATILKIVLDEAPRMSEIVREVPADLDELVDRMLAKAADARPRDAAAVADALRRLAPLGLARAVASPRCADEITATERRVITIVLARPGRELPKAAEGSTVLMPRGRDLALVDVVARHRASLATLADGTLLVSFEGRGAASEQATRAARCAGAMRELLPDGAIVVAFAQGESGGRVPMGDVIEQSTRLLDVGPRGVVRLEPGIAGLLEGRFDVASDAIGPTLGGERPEVTARLTLLGKPTPCVGRDRELSMLEAILEQSIDESSARAVLVTAEPGIGKSRLRAELVRRVADKDDPIAVWLAEADPMSARDSLHLIARMIRDVAQIREGEPAATREAKLVSRVQRHVPSADVRRVSEFLCTLGGVPFGWGSSAELEAARQDPEVMHDQMRAAWEDFVRAEASAQPLVLVFEDLHWGDAASVKFVDATLRNLAELPILVVAFARPEIEATFPRLWANRGVQPLPLRELGKKSSERLVKNGLGADASAELVARIVERGAGNPFYLEELVRSEAAGRGDELPQSVLATVSARFERLDPEARRILRAASVFGRVFWRGGVLALLGGDGGARAAVVDDWLRILAELEVVAPETPSRFAGDEELAFRHALGRDAAYATLPEADRATGHRLAGAWLEGAGETDSNLLAEHFGRGGDAARAVACYRRSAERALDAGDLEGTLTLANQAMTSGAEGDDAAALTLVMAAAARALGDTERAATLGARALAASPGGSVVWCKAATIVASTAQLRGDLRELTRVAALVELLPGGTNHHTAAAARVAQELLFAGDLETAARLSANAASLRPVDLDPPTRGAVLRCRALRALILDRDHGENLRLIEATVVAYEEAGDRQNACQALASLGSANIHVGLFELAASALERALALALRLGLAWAEGAIRQNLGYALMNLGRSDDARAHLETSERLLAKAEDVRMTSNTLVCLAKLALAEGDFAGAERAMLDARGKRGATPPTRALVLAVHGEVLLAAGRAPEALLAIEEALAILASVGSLELGEVLIRVLHAEALAAVGDERAASALADAERHLFERANRIKNPEIRASFLERVPENARTLQRVREAAAKREDPRAR